VPGLVGAGPGPVIPAWAFRTGPGTGPVPAAGRQGAGDLIGAQAPFAAREGWYPVIAGDRQHVAQPEGGGPGAEGAVVPIEFVSCHPGGGHAGRHRISDHVQGQFGLGCEPRAGGNACSRAPGPVIGP
jgi:hypothetical protein